MVKPLEICHIKVRLTTTGMKHRHAAIHHHKMIDMFSYAAVLKFCFHCIINTDYGCKYKTYFPISPLKK